MQNQAVYDLLQALAPNRLAASWDNCGLQVGSLQDPLKGVLVALNPSLAAMQQAKKLGANLLVTHHPLAFKLPSQLDTTREPGSLIAEAIRNELTVVSAHTSLDVVVVNHLLANRLELSLDRVLAPTGRSARFKLVVFVPLEATLRVAEAMWSAGAGRLGNYEEASFRTEGIGTFLPMEGAHPAIGAVGKREEVFENRLEVLVTEDRVKAVLAAMRESHPYEEVAYDLIRLETGDPYGFGLWGEVEPLTIRELARRAHESLHPRSLRVVCDDLDRPIRKVGVCGGSGGDLVAAALENGLDLFVTGECKYHTALEAKAKGLAILEAGHLATEQPVVGYLIEYLKERIGVPVQGFWDEEPFEMLPMVF